MGSMSVPLGQRPTTFLAPRTGSSGGGGRGWFHVCNLILCLHKLSFALLPAACVVQFPTCHGPVAGHRLGSWGSVLGDHHLLLPSPQSLAELEATKQMLQGSKAPGSSRFAKKRNFTREYIGTPWLTASHSFSY